MSTPIRKRTWQESFEALKKYKATHGDCLVPIHNYHEDLALGGWVNHQRSKKHKLSAEQKQKLDSVGFTWSVRMRNKQWNQMMDKLKTYKEEHDGDCNVPVVYEADSELADFCQEQRKKFARGQLSGARQKQLQDIGLTLELEQDLEEDVVLEEEDEPDSGNMMQQYDDAFDKSYQQLVDFHVNHGHCDIPLESHALGPWVTALRLKYKEHAESGFSDDCFELLEELGFDWDGPTSTGTSSGDGTETATPAAKKEEKKSSAAVAKAVADVVAKAVAVEVQATNNDEDKKVAAVEVAVKKEENDKEEDIASDASESIGTDEEESNNHNDNDNSDSESLSSSEDDNTDSENDDDNDNKTSKPKGFSIMSMKRKSSIITSGMPKKPRRLSSLPINHKKKPMLQVSRKRPALALPTNKSNNSNSHHSSTASAASSTGTGSSSKKARRSSVNSNSSQQTYCPSRDERFMKQYQDLLEFKKQYGHTRVPQSKKWKTLGGWVNNLRVMYKRDPINGVRKERVQLLNDAGFVWNATADMPSYDVRWEEQYTNLLEFKKEYGHCRVPQTGPHRKLGRWVATQRALYTKDPLNGIRSDRLKRLNDIEFTWDAKGFKGKHFYTNTTGPGTPTTDADGNPIPNEEDPNADGTNTTAAAAVTVSSSSATSAEKPSVAVTTADSSSTESDDDDDGSSVAAVVAAVEGEIPASSIAVAVPVPEDGDEVDPTTTVGVEDVVVDTEYDVVWDQYYAKLVEYQKVYKNFKVPATYDANLSRWVKLQRERKQEKDPRHVKLLDAIGFDWVVPRSSNPNKEQPSLNDVRWEQLYHQLVAYKTQHGHCRVPQNGENKRLGKWVATQRLLHNKGHESGLRPERFKLLDDLGFTWNAKEFRSRKFSNNITATTKTPDLCTDEGKSQTEDSASGMPKALAFPSGTANQDDGDAKPVAVDSGSNPSTSTSININDTTSSLSISGRIQPLVAKLCELMDHSGSSYSNSSSKLDYIERYKRSLEGMIDETKARLESYKQLGPTKKEDPPAATAIKNEP